MDYSNSTYCSRTLLSGHSAKEIVLSIRDGSAEVRGLLLVGGDFVTGPNQHRGSEPVLSTNS